MESVTYLPIDIIKHVSPASEDPIRRWLHHNDVIITDVNSVDVFMAGERYGLPEW